MKERPIIFSGEMVRAILEERKTQTRRVMKVQPEFDDESKQNLSDYLFCGAKAETGGMNWPDKCPYGIPGNRLWVRETWKYAVEQDGAQCVAYKADGAGRALYCDHGGYGDNCEIREDVEPWEESLKSYWKPSIYMPRWASRILLEVTNVKAERLQDITEEDAKAEGVEITGGCPHWMPTYYDPDSGGCCTYRCAFEHLWNSINTKPGKRWEDNPWVWVVEFKPIEGV